MLAQIARDVLGGLGEPITRLGVQGSPPDRISPAGDRGGECRSPAWIGLAVIVGEADDLGARLGCAEVSRRRGPATGTGYQARRGNGIERLAYRSGVARLIVDDNDLDGLPLLR